MAERTGKTYLDAIIDEFQYQGSWSVEVYDWHEDAYVSKARPLRDLKAPHIARGQCVHVTDEFNRFLRLRGVPCGVPTLDGRPALVPPEALGYADRPLSGLAEHTLSLVSYGGELYSVDWTAAQYGYAEFPLVQRLEDGRWRRDLGWARLAA